MTTPRDTDRLVRAFLDDGPTVLPDRVAESALGEVHRTPQRARWGLRRTQPMSRTAFAAAAVIAVVAVASLALWMNQPNGQPAAGTTPSPSTASPSAAAASPSLSASASLPVGVTAPGTILFERHDPISNMTTLHAMSPDGTADVTTRIG